MKTLLFVPANRPEYFSKISRSKPDGVIADLEDAVPASEKATARRNLASLHDALSSNGTKLLVRINSEPDYWEGDLEAAAQSGADFVVIPKADSVEQVVALDRLASFFEGKHGRPFGSTRFLLIPETASGIRNLYALCRATARVTATMTPVSGPIAGDVARAVGYSPTLVGDEQLYVQGSVILDSRAAGATPFAGIIGLNLTDQQAAATLIQRARRLGFDGLALIHPGHVELAKHLFRPSHAQLEEARELVAAYEIAARNGQGALRFRDAMVDLAMVQRARDLLTTWDQAQ